MFYLLRSSAIVCDHDRRIADDRRSMFPYDRRRSQTIADLIAICDLRSAIIWKPAFNMTSISTQFGDLIRTLKLLKKEF